MRKTGRAGPRPPARLRGAACGSRGAAAPSRPAARGRARSPSPPPHPPRARPWGLPSALFPFPTSLAFHFGGFPPFLFAFAGRAGAAAACPVPPRPVKPPRRAAPWALPPAARGGRLPPPRAADRARPPLSHCPPPRRASRSSQRWRKQSRAGPGRAGEPRTPAAGPGAWGSPASPFARALLCPQERSDRPFPGVPVSVAFVIKV